MDFVHQSVREVPEKDVSVENENRFSPVVSVQDEPKLLLVFVNFRHTDDLGDNRRRSSLRQHLVDLTAYSSKAIGNSYLAWSRQVMDYLSLPQS